MSESMSITPNMSERMSFSSNGQVAELATVCSANGLSSAPPELKRFLDVRRALLTSSLAVLAYYFSRRAQPSAVGLSRHPVFAAIVRLRAASAAMEPAGSVAHLRAKELLAGQGALSAASRAVRAVAASPAAARTNGLGPLRGRKALGTAPVAVAGPTLPTVEALRHQKKVRAVAKLTVGNAHVEKICLRR